MLLDVYLFHRRALKMEKVISIHILFAQEIVLKQTFEECCKII